jgi:putative DNA primase/helicase
MNDRRYIEQSEANGAKFLDSTTASKMPDIILNDISQQPETMPAPPEVQQAYDEQIQKYEPKQSVNLVNGRDIKIEPITWLWPGWLAAGKIHILGGAPGAGKTTIAMAFAATISRGQTWPDESKAKIGNVVIWSGEDDFADTLAPRLLASGADLSRIYFIKDVGEGLERRVFDPARDMGALKSKLAHIKDVRLLIVDPVVSAISGDSHKNSEVRRGLMPLDDLARSMRCAVLGITHFTKGTSGREPVERINGSLAFGALARIVMVAVRQQEEDEDGRRSRLLLRAKSNISEDSGGFEYDLSQEELASHSGVTVSRTVWGKVVEGTARELLATAEAVPEDENHENGSVLDWLRQLLEDENGEIDRRDVMKAANAMGYKERTVHRAREKLGLIVKQTGFGKNKKSLWASPPNETVPDRPNRAKNPPIMPIMPTNFVGTHGTIGTNGDNNIVEVDI